MKKKLLFINGHLNTGGVEKSLIDLLKHLDYDRYEVDLLLLETIGDYAAEVPAQVKVNLRSLENTYGALGQCILRCIKQRDWFSLKMRLIFFVSKRWNVKFISVAKKMLTGNQHYDCVIGYRPGICTQLASFAVDADRRVTWWHHGEINVGQEYLDEVKNCQAIAVVSDVCRAMLAESFPSIADKMVTIPNMIDTYIVGAKAEEFDPYPDKSVLQIVSVGRLVPEKHFENVIYAAKKLKDRGLKFQWHLVGTGAVGDMLRKLALDLGVADCFFFEGNQPNPYPYMKHADLFVHSSYVESFGIVVAEALALGLLCVVTCSAGIMSFIEDGKNAVIAEQSQEDLSKKVQMILKDEMLCDRLRENAHCPAQFLPDAVMALIEKLLEASYL